MGTKDQRQHLRAPTPTPVQVGVGCQRMGLDERPTILAQKQALAAVGQLHLMRCYDDLFSTLGLVRRAAPRRAALGATVLGGVWRVGGGRVGRWVGR